MLGAWLPHPRARQVLLLTASYFYYWTWAGWFLALLVASSVVNFGLARLVRRRRSPTRLWVAIALNVSLLYLFRYMPSLGSAEASGAWGSVGTLGPIGISFWTFQALSYVYDVYREDEADPSLLEFCLYMAFWPTVLMGPICRLSKLLPQFRHVRSLSVTDVQSGTYRIALGVFMKLVCAQLLATGWYGRGGVVAGFDTPTALGGLDVWALALGFGLQLFFDFAAYSHIVIGAARIFGFRLAENFHAPYLARSPTEFWQCWHMSLSSWIRDYVFLPMAMSRRGTTTRFVALVLSMTLFGLWHGATVAFVAWGIYNGVLLVLHRIGQQLAQKYRLPMDSRFAAVASWAFTLLLVSLGWVLFRASSVALAFEMYRAVLSPSTYRATTLAPSFYVLVASLAAACLACQFLAPRLEAWLARRLMGAGSPGRVAGESPAERVFGYVYRSWRWLAVPPLLLLVWYAWLLAVAGNAPTDPFVYRLF